MEQKQGFSSPLGATVDSQSWWNFAVYSPHPVKQLVLGDYATGEITHTFALDPTMNRTGDIWHIAIPAPADRFLWGWQVNQRCGPQASQVAPLAVDPYATLLKTGNGWGENAWEKVTSKQGALVGVASLPLQFSWNTPLHTPLRPESLVVYESHVRGFTRHASSRTAYPGTYLGMIDHLPHLKALGITAIELLPIAEFDESEWKAINPISGQRLYNYWGYSPLSFFSPMQRYGTTNDPIQTAEELKRLVSACHDLGIAVILDVVYNHTGEGNEHGPAYSWKLFDEPSYYILNKDRTFANFSGCGNSLNANHPVVADLILASLRHWALEYRIDGFRFDLASAMTRNQRGAPMAEPTVIEAIVKDPVVSKCLLIVEPWDAAGLYQTGGLFTLNQCGENAFLEWNDRFRDDVRKFIRGTEGMSGPFATRLCGSEDIYGTSGSPKNSLNYVTAHDGFCLYDLVSYNTKHNFENGEHNRDGMHENYSWNCGVEGPSEHKNVLRLRYRQVKNFLVALFLSQGVPMMLTGDEYARTKNGNNNTWCQDSPLSWLNWDEMEANAELSSLVAILLALRQETPCFHRPEFLTSDDVEWHGNKLHSPSWEKTNHLVAFSLLDEEQRPCLFIAFNASTHEQTIEIPPPGLGSWHCVVNTSKTPPDDVFKLRAGPRIRAHSLTMAPHSSLVLHAG